MTVFSLPSLFISFLLQLMAFAVLYMLKRKSRFLKIISPQAKQKDTKRQ